MTSRRWSPSRAVLSAALDTGGGGAGARELPADGEQAEARLASSPRHGEWVRYDGGDGDQVSAWVVYPERSDPAPVVVVIHEIYGLSDWIRSVADRLAAEGYLAIAPDLLSGKAPGGGGVEAMNAQQIGLAIRDLDRAEVNRRLKAAAAYATGLPSTTDHVGVVGFCWGGTSSFAVATDWDDLDAAVVYYGTSPDAEGLRHVRAPVLGHYGGDDNRVNATIPHARAEMDRLGKFYEPNIYEGAGHGFLRQQDGRDGANLKATQSAWPRTIAFFREHLDR